MPRVLVATQKALRFIIDCKEQEKHQVPGGLQNLSSRSSSKYRAAQHCTVSESVLANLGLSDTSCELDQARVCVDVLLNSQSKLLIGIITLLICLLDCFACIG